MLLRRLAMLCDAMRQNVWHKTKELISLIDRVQGRMRSASMNRCMVIDERKHRKVYSAGAGLEILLHDDTGSSL